MPTTAAAPADTGPIQVDANADGMLFAMRFDADGVGRLLPSVPTPVLAPGEAGFIWIHLSLADVRARAWLKHQPALHEDVVVAMQDMDEAPQMVFAGGVLGGVLTDLTMELDHPTDDPARLGFALGTGFLVTGRRRPVQSVQRVTRRVADGETVAAPTELLRLILECEIECLSDRIEALSAAVERIEDRLLGDHVIDERRPIASMRRTAFNLNRHAYQMLALFRSLSRQRARHVPADVREAFEDAGQRVESLQNELQSIKERARLLQEEAASKLAMETNRQLYILSLLSGVFLPATLVTGFFGMNTAGIIEGTHTWWATAFGIAASVAVYIGITRFGGRRK